MDNKDFKAIQIQGISANELNAKFDLLLNKLDAISSPSEPVKEKLLTRLEVCEILNITLVTLHHWRNNGIIKAYRIGNKVRFKENEVLEALTSIKAKKQA